MLLRPNMCSFRHWNAMGIDIPCPFHFTEEELRSHVKDGEGWNDVQDFWDSVAGIVSRDGWTPNDAYAKAFEFFSELRKNALDNMTGKEKESFEAQTRWAE